MAGGGGMILLHIVGKSYDKAAAANVIITTLSCNHNIATTSTQHLHNIHTTFTQHLHNIDTTFTQHRHNIDTTLSEAGMIILAKIFLKEGDIFFMCTVPELIFSIVSLVGE